MEEERLLCIQLKAGHHCLGGSNPTWGNFYELVILTKKELLMLCEVMWTVICTRDLQALTLVEPTVARLVQDPLAVLISLDNQLFMMPPFAAFLTPSMPKICALFCGSLLLMVTYIVDVSFSLDCSLQNWFQ